MTVDPIVDLAFREGLIAHAGSNPYLKTSTAWEAFEVGAYLSAFNHRRVDLIRQRGSTFTTQIPGSPAWTYRVSYVGKKGRWKVGLAL